MASAPQGVPVRFDPMIGRNVEVRSTGGMRYCGIVRSIRVDRELGELFELGSSADAGYRRLVYVTDRFAQVSEIASDA